MHQAKERELLEAAKVIAVVGYSSDPSRASYQIGSYLKGVGYTVYPINPTIDEVDGERVYHSLAEVPEPIDIVDVFRRSEFLDGVVDEAIAVKAKAVWAQLGIFDDAAAEKARAAGLDIIMDTCIKVAHQHWAKQGMK